MEGLRKITKNLRIVDVPAEVRTRVIPDKVRNLNNQVNFTPVTTKRLSLNIILSQFSPTASSSVIGIALSGAYKSIY
jgi:hypothetical protein